MDLNLDLARAARAEARDEPPTVTIGGETFTLPAELPMRYVWALADESDDVTALKVLFNGQLERFLALEPSRDDILALVAGVPKLYGLAPGESSASDGSSANGSGRSRPTSVASTRSTSAKRAGARRR